MFADLTAFIQIGHSTIANGSSGDYSLNVRLFDGAGRRENIEAVDYYHESSSAGSRLPCSWLEALRSSDLKINRNEVKES